MIKSWYVVCEVNMDASSEEKVTIKANTQRNAERSAINKLHKEGYFHVKIISCKEVK